MRKAAGQEKQSIEGTEKREGSRYKLTDL